MNLTLKGEQNSHQKDKERELGKSGCVKGSGNRDHV